MLTPLRTRLPGALVRTLPRATYSTSVNQVPANDPKGESRPTPPNVSATNAMPVSSEGSFDKVLQEDVAAAEKMRTMQAPNRATVWSTSQQPRAKAMVGPRFEQTIMEDQPRPWAAIELIHKQPVRWRHDRIVSCDGGGGPLGHPRVYINLDQPHIHDCTYCGLPFANEHFRKEIENTPHLQTHPLGPTSDPAAVEESQTVEGAREPLHQR